MRLTEIEVPGYERVVHCVDAVSGLNAFISIHDTTLGPSLGGLRMLPYASDDDALSDANLLAKAMTYKAAMADTGQGGGKGVIVGDPAQKTGAMLRAMGRFIDAMDGQYITAEDMNITEADLEIVAEETRWVSGLSRERGSSGNPSPFTAEGCVLAFQTCLQEVYGDPSLQNRRICVQGIGAVGSVVARLCDQAGAHVAVCDIDKDKVNGFVKDSGAEPLESVDAWQTYECDVLAPCARGGILNRETIPKLRCRIVAGAANNQLDRPEDARRLQEREILYAPDYVVNAGGIINIACEFMDGGYNEATANTKLQNIRHALEQVFALTRETNLTTAEASDHLAEQRLQAAKGRA